jgi:hypothetical protein
MFNTTASRIAGIGLAVGVSLLVAKYWRPALKGAIKGYMALSDRVREATAEAGEGMQDLYAEAKAEHEKARQEAKAARMVVQQPPVQAETQAQ